VPDEKDIVWVGTALGDLRDFPHDARQDAGFQLEQVQFGFDPDDWGPVNTVGTGSRSQGEDQRRHFSRVLCDEVR
jgi:phage-related protein